ncbi:MAG: hypothetical protein ACRC5T_05210 [Cetobacterium sp.]
MSTKSILLRDGIDFLLPITSSKNIYLDDKGTTLKDVSNNDEVISGNWSDKLLIIHANNTEVEHEVYHYTLNGILDDSAYFLDIFISSVRGQVFLKINERTPNSKSPKCVMIDNTIVIDISQFEIVKLYNQYYNKCMFKKFEPSQNNIIEFYNRVMEYRPDILPGHLDYNDFIVNVFPNYATIEKSIIFNYATKEDINNIFNYTPELEDYTVATDADIENLFIKAVKIVMGKYSVSSEYAVEKYKDEIEKIMFALMTGSYDEKM